MCRWVKNTWSIEFKGGAKLIGKTLNGWDAKEEKIVRGAMSSDGSVQVGSVAHDKAAKSLTISLTGVDGDGEEISSKIVLTKTGKDTLTWQALERTGGIVKGPSPVYSYNRVKRAKKAAK